MGLKRYSVAVADLTAALDFYQEMFGVEVLYDDDSTSQSVRKTGVQLANTVVELLTPTGDGPIASHLQRYGDGLRSSRCAAWITQSITSPAMASLSFQETATGPWRSRRSTTAG